MDYWPPALKRENKEGFEGGGGLEAAGQTTASWSSTRSPACNYHCSEHSTRPCPRDIALLFSFPTVIQVRAGSIEGRSASILLHLLRFAVYVDHLSRRSLFSASVVEQLFAPCLSYIHAAVMPRFLEFVTKLFPGERCVWLKQQTVIIISNGRHLRDQPAE